MTLNYIELKKEYEAKKKQEKRAKKANNENNDKAYEARIKFQAKSTWNGTYK
jgi:hypothetical protein